MDENSLICEYYYKGYNNSEILATLASEDDIYISKKTLSRRMKSMGLKRRTSNNDVEYLKELISSENNQCSGRVGYRLMQTRLLQKHKVFAPRSIIMNILSEIDPEESSNRRNRTLVRRSYFNTGPNFLVHIDGYDKLKNYGFPIHGAIDGYSRKILWLVAGHTNNDPDYVARFFADYIEEIGGVPRRLRVDRGSENVVIADIEVAVRSEHSDDVCGEKSVMFGSSNHNQIIERWWRSGRAMGFQYFMDFFSALEEQSLLESGSYEHITCMRYCFMDIINANLDIIRNQWNGHRVRSCNRGPVGGVPDFLYSSPGLNGTIDYKFAVDPEILALVKSSYTKRPLMRGIQEYEKEYLDSLAEESHLTSTPLTLEDAAELYSYLIAHFDLHQV